MRSEDWFNAGKTEILDGNPPAFFYRRSGNPQGKLILLLHGFPSPLPSEVAEHWEIIRKNSGNRISHRLIH